MTTISEEPLSPEDRGQVRQDLSEEPQKKITEQTIAVAWISIKLCLIQR